MKQFTKLCECGCGGAARRRFILGHNKRSKLVVIEPSDYHLEDLGYSTPCWISRWKSDHPRGYVRIRSENKRVGAHVLMWTQVNGPVPDGLQIDHLCFQTGCINPDHLEAVTPRVNTRRSRVAKLNPERVLEVRRLRALGMKEEDIARRVGTTRGAVNHILRGMTWKDIR